MKMNTVFAGKGKAYWRSLDQLAQTTRFKEFLHREFPEGASEADHNNWSRRSFLTLMGASIALAGLSGIRTSVTSYPLERANDAIEDLRSGSLNGAAVLVTDQERRN